MSTKKTKTTDNNNNNKYKPVECCGTAPLIQEGKLFNTLTGHRVVLAFGSMMFTSVDSWPLKEDALQAGEEIADALNNNNS